MKCLNCRKKKENLLCPDCSIFPSHYKAQKTNLLPRITSLKTYLETKVLSILPFYFDSQELKEKQLKIAYYKQILRKTIITKQAQDHNLLLIKEKHREKQVIKEKILCLKEIFLIEITKTKEKNQENLSYITKLQKKLAFLQRKKLLYYNTLLEINYIYPNWSITREFRLEEEGDFTPIEEEDIKENSFDSNSLSSIESNEKTYKISFLKPFNSLNEIYGKIMAFSINQLGKALYYCSRVFGVHLPLVMDLIGDNIQIKGFVKNKGVFQVSNVFIRKNYKETEKFLVFLLMNYKYLIKALKLQEVLLTEWGFIDWEAFSTVVLSKKGEKKENKGKIKENIVFSLIKVKYEKKTMIIDTYFKPNARVKENLLVSKEDFEFGNSPLIILNTMLKENSPKSHSSYEIFDNLDNLTDTEF